MERWDERQKECRDVGLPGGGGQEGGGGCCRGRGSFEKRLHPPGMPSNQTHPTPTDHLTQNVVQVMALHDKSKRASNNRQRRAQCATLAKTTTCCWGKRAALNRRSFQAISCRLGWHGIQQLVPNIQHFGGRSSGINWEGESARYPFHGSNQCLVFPICL